MKFASWLTCDIIGVFVPPRWRSEITTIFALFISFTSLIVASEQWDIESATLRNPRAEALAEGLDIAITRGPRLQQPRVSEKRAAYGHRGLGPRGRGPPSI